MKILENDTISFLLIVTGLPLPFDFQSKVLNEDNFSFEITEELEGNYIIVLQSAE